MKFIKSFIQGIAIGAGAILPGISSGVLCVVFGIYETLLNSVLSFLKNIKYNFKILFPICLGVFCGVIIFGNILRCIFYAYPTQIKLIFIVLILSSIPELIKKACMKQTFKLRYLFYLILSFLIGFSLVILEKNLHTKVSIQNEFSYFYIILSGILMSAGVIIPGISSTLILMLLGIYDAYLVSISTIYLPFLLPLAFRSYLWLFCMHENYKIPI